MTSTFIYLPLNPEPWATGSAFVKRGGGKSFAAISPNKTLVAYQEAVRAELADQGVQLLDGPYRLRMWLWRENVTYTDAGGRKRSRNSPDVTNMLKATEDALQGSVIGNDVDVIHTEVRLMARGKGVSPGVLIEVTQLDVDYPSSAPGDILPFSEIPETGQVFLFQAREKLAEREAAQDAANEWIPGE